jgi:hypothetical protein
MFYYDMKDLYQYARMLTSRSMMIRCGDNECINSINPFFYCFHGFLPSFNTYDNLHPFSVDMQRRFGFATMDVDGDELREVIPALMMALELGEEHIVFGPERLVEESLQKLLTGKHSPYFLSHSCLNKVIGVDLDGILKKVSDEARVKVISDQNMGIRQILDSASRAYGPGVRKRRRKPGRRKEINLVGFVRDRSYHELCSMLGMLGVAVHRSPVPDLSFSSLDDLDRADLQVLNPLDEYQDVYEEFFRTLGVPTIEPPAPHGMEASVSWLESVARELGIDPGRRRKWKACCRDGRESWDRLVARVGEYRIGFVLDPRDIDFLLAPSAWLFGLPMVEMLEEMGFGVDVLVRKPCDEADCRERLARLVREPDTLSIDFAARDEDVDRWLETSPCRCVYSDLKNDVRITSRGKAPFSIFLFEKGIEGALRTIRRLLYLCELEYFDEYKGFRKTEARPARV